MTRRQIRICFSAVAVLLIGACVAAPPDLEKMAQELRDIKFPERVDEITGERRPIAITMRPRHHSPYRKLQQTFGIEEIRWPKSRDPSTNGAITAIDCYTELTKQHEGKLLVLVNRYQLPHRPCLLRILGRRRIQFLQLNVSDPRSHVSILAGNDLGYMPLKTTAVGPRTPTTRYGPFYVPCITGYVQFESYTKARRESVYLVMEPAELEDLEDDQAAKCRPGPDGRNWLDRRFQIPVVVPADPTATHSSDSVGDHPRLDFAKWHKYNIPSENNEDEESD